MKSHAARKERKNIRQATHCPLRELAAKPTEKLTAKPAERPVPR